jgi:MtrB/PioB family decaheme-associated outer membrane protein
MDKPNTLIAFAVTSVLAAGTAAADNAAGVDTSGWECESCPFQTDYEAEAEIGVLYVDEDAAKFGEYNGLDEKGAYADVNANGGSRNESGTYYRYDLRELGLDTREAEFVFGKEGMVEARLSYDELPHRVWDTTVTPYQRSGKDTLVLPSGWVPAGSTGGMTALAGSLSNVDIGTDRTTIGAGLDYLFGSNLKLFADYSRQEIEGRKLGSANFLFSSLQLPEPVDAAHDQIEIGATYRWKSGFARLAWYGSIYDNTLTGMTFDNPYVPIASDTVQGRKALAPDNKAQTYSLDGNFLLPWWQGVVSYRLAEGTMDQDESFLPFSTSAALSATAVLPRSNLAGDVSTSHYRATLSLKPHPRIRARFGYRYDERDDGTRPFTSAFVDDDSLPAPAATSLRYGYERTLYDGFGEVKVLDWLYLGLGGESDEIDRSNQASRQTQEEGSYVQVRMRPWSSIELSGRYGQSHIDAGDYVVTPGSPPENPLLRKFNQTNRDRDYSEVRVGWSPWKLSIALEGTYAFDAYRLSPLGLRSGRDYRYAGTVSWPVSEKTSVYVSGSYQNIATEQAGEEVFPSTANLWLVTHEDEFTTAGGGIVWNDVAGKVDVTLDYTYAKSRGLVDTVASPQLSAGAFPKLETELNSLRLSASYDVNERLRVGAGWTWEDYDSSDWQIAGVGPSTLPNLLSMSPDPYKYSVNVIGVSFSYRFGKSSPEEE